MLEQTLLRPAEEARGHATFLKFPLGTPDCDVEIYPLASSVSGCFVRISRATEGSGKPPTATSSHISIERLVNCAP